METEKSVPLGLLIRCKRICSEETHFNREANIIIQKLTSRKYPTNLLEEALEKGKEDGQITITKTKQQKTIR